MPLLDDRTRKLLDDYVALQQLKSGQKKPVTQRFGGTPAEPPEGPGFPGTIAPAIQRGISAAIRPVGKGISTWGKWVGGAAEWATSPIMDDLIEAQFGPVAGEEYRASKRLAAERYNSIKGEQGFLAALDDHFYTWSEVREGRTSLFPAEKFITEMVFDPTTYMGFGLGKKVPILGKLGLELLMDTAPKWAGNLVGKTAAGAVRGFTVGAAMPVAKRLGGMLFSPSIRSVATARGREAATATMRMLGRAVRQDESRAAIDDILLRNDPRDAEKLREAVISMAHTGKGLEGAEEILKAVQVEHLLNTGKTYPGRGEDFIKEALAAAELGKLPLGQRGGMKAMEVGQLLLDGMTPREMVDTVDSLVSLYTSNALREPWQAYMKGKTSVITTLADTGDVKGMSRFAAQFGRYAITEPARALLVFSTYGMMNTMEDGIRSILGGHFPKRMVGDDLDLIRGSLPDFNIIRTGEQGNWNMRFEAAEKAIPTYLQAPGIRTAAKYMMGMNSWFQDIGANVRRGFAAKEFRNQLRKIATEKQLLSGTKGVRTSVDRALDIMKKHYPRAFKSEELGRVGDIAEVFILKGQVDGLPMLSRVVLEQRLSGLKEAITLAPSVPFGVRAAIEMEIKANGFGLADPARFEAVRKVVYKTLDENARKQPELVLEGFENTATAMEKMLVAMDAPARGGAESLQETRTYWNKNLEHNPLRGAAESDGGAFLIFKLENAGDILREAGKASPDGGYIAEKVRRIESTLNDVDWRLPVDRGDEQKLAEVKQRLLAMPAKDERTAAFKKLAEAITERDVPQVRQALEEVKGYTMGGAQPPGVSLTEGNIRSFLKELNHGMEQLHAQQRSLIQWEVPPIFNNDKKTRDAMWQQLGETRVRVAEKAGQVTEHIGRVIDLLAEKADKLGAESKVSVHLLRRLKSAGTDVMALQKGYVVHATDLDKKWFDKDFGGLLAKEWDDLEERLINGDLTTLVGRPQVWRTALERGTPSVTVGKYQSQGVYLTVKGLRQYMPIEEALKLAKNNRGHVDELRPQMYMIRQHSLHEAKTAYFADDAIPAKFLGIVEEIGKAEADTSVFPRFAEKIEGSEHILAGMDTFRNWQNQVDLVMDDLRKRVSAPQPDVTAIESWLTEMADELRKMPPEQLKLLQDGATKAWEETEKVVKGIFNNYDNAMVVDDALRTIFPFWQYQSRSLPWLLGASAAHPLIAANLWSQGRFWKYTEDGYLPTHVADMQIMPLRGTVFARMRRMWRGEYPPSVSGVGGYVESMSGLTERLGFFPGVGVEAIAQASTSIAGGGELEEILSPLMEGMPPIMSSAVDAMIVASRIEPDFTITLAEKLLPSKYRSYYMEKMLWENHRITVKQAKKQGHEDWIAQAYSDVAIRQMVESQVSLTRLQPESWQKIYEDLGKLMATELGITHEEYEKLRLQARAEGKRITEILPMSRIERSKMSVVEGIDAIASAGLVLSPEERRRYLTARADYYDTLNGIRERNKEKQLVEDAALLSGDMTTDKWIDAQHDRTVEYKAFAEQALQSTYFGQIGVTKEEQKALATEFRLVSMETHPIDAALDDYYSMEPQPDPYDDSELDWGTWRKAQEDRIAALPPEDAAKVKEYLQRNLTPLQKQYREGLSAASAWFDYEDGIVKFYRDMGNDRRADYMHDIFLRRTELMREENATMFHGESPRSTIRELNRLNRVVKREQARYRQMILSSDPTVGPFLQKFFSIRTLTS